MILKRIRYASVKDRFESFVYPDPNSGCFIYAGSGVPKGYGNFWDGKKLMRAHRYAWEFANGPIPPGLHVCHKCDTPSCVNVDHLFLGDNDDNRADMVRKDRGRRGRRGFPRGVQPMYRRFTASLSAKGRTIYLGLFLTVEEAAAAVQAAKEAR